MPGSYSWTLPTPVSTPAQTTTPAAAPLVRRARFQARGLLVPFQRDGKGDFANGSGDAFWVSKVLQVLAMKPGECDWAPKLGCDIHKARHKNDTPILRAMIRSSIQEAFTNWLPSLVLTDVLFRAEGRALHVEVWFNEWSGAGKRFAEDLTATVPVTLAG